MLSRVYFIYAVLILAGFAYSSHIGLSFWDAVKTGKWKPQGHSAYHK